MHSSAVLSLFRLLFFCEVAVGVGGSDERDQSAPTQTAPQQVGFGSDRDCGVDKVSRAPHDNGLGSSHTPDTSIIYTTYLVPGTRYYTWQIGQQDTRPTINSGHLPIGSTHRKLLRLL